MLCVGLVCASCVHEFPEAPCQPEVRLNIEHELSWSEYDFIYDNSDATRAAGNVAQARYIIRAYRSGDTPSVPYEFVRTTSDLSLKPFYTSLFLPEGEWDIYVWQDIVEENRPFYDVADFARITYTDPYEGATDSREAFEGRCSITVRSGNNTDATVSLERPFAKYAFIATDFGKFYDEVLVPSSRDDSRIPVDKKMWTTLSLQEKKELLSGYTVTACYPLFMPSVYDLFDQRPVSSDRGKKYTAQIEPLGDTEALIAFDYVFMNHRDNDVQVQLVLHTPEGSDIVMSPIVEVPLRRNRITYVRGGFLTSGISGGLDIDFEFGGDFNIEI